MYDVICIGSATYDMFATILERFDEPEPGDKVRVDHIEGSVGGGAVNSSIALARMGLKVAALSKYGADQNARMIENKLRKEGVKIIRTKKSADFTAYSYILTSSKESDRIIYTYKGASDNLSADDFDMNSLKSQWIYMATMMGKSFNTCEKIAGYAKKNGIRLLFNPSTYLAKKGKEYLKTILNCSDILVLNKSEAKLLLKTNENDDIVLAESLSRLGPKMVVITDGKRGIHAYDGSCKYSMKPYHVKVVHTTGAGDAFTAGFLAGIIKKNDPAHALELGMANAASTIQHYGATNGLLSYSSAKDFVKKHKKEEVMKVKC